MLKIFASLFLLCICALSFMVSAEVVIDQSCQYELALVDSMHIAPDATVDSVGIGVDTLNNHEHQEISLTASESLSGSLEADAPERYDKVKTSA